MDLLGLDSLIRRGHSRAAAAEIRRQVLQRHTHPVRQQDLLPLATLCRRVGYAEGGLKLLAHLVRPSGRRLPTATPAETVEYAAALNQLGLLVEARELLKAVSAVVPQRDLFMAFSYFSEWNYAAALPHLRHYLHAYDLEPYTRLIGEVNLAASLVELKQWSEAEPLLASLAERCKAQGYSLLLGNVFEIWSRISLNQNHFALTEERLNAAATQLQAHTNTDKLFLLKWQTVLEIRQHGLNTQLRHKLLQAAELARDMLSWETVRDCHFQLALARPSVSAIERLYWGTPYPAYRERIKQEFQFEPNRSTYDWILQSGTQRKSSPILDTLSGVCAMAPLSRRSRNNSGPCGQEFKPGQLQQRFLFALASDFYKPFTIPSLHQHLYPRQYYNPESSPQMVHQALKRLRQWIKVRHLPLKVEETRGRYYLRATKPLRLRLHQATEDWQQHHYEAEARKKFRWQAFSRKEFAAYFQLSKRSAVYKLNDLVLAKSLLQIGQGRAVRYQFVKGV